MADLAVELAELNSHARELITKYNESFERLDETSKELAEKLMNDINGYLDELKKAKDDSLNEIVEKLNNGINELNTIIESGEFTRVITRPVIDLSGVVSAGHEKSFSVSAKSLLNGAEIEKFEVTIGTDLIEVNAIDGKADITYKFDGNVGDKVSISVIAIDNLGNKSTKTTKEVELVENTPPTAPMVNAPSEVTKNSSFTITISGSSDNEGDSVTYKIKDTGNFTFAKTEAIAENEEVKVTAPNVTEDTEFSFSVVAVDSNGLESAAVSVSVLVKDITYGTVDILGDGSCVAYFPLKNDFADLSGNSIVTHDGDAAAFNELGYYTTNGQNNNSKTYFNDGNSDYIGDVNTNSPYKYFNIGTRYTMSVQIKIRDLSRAFTILQTGNYDENSTASLANMLDFRVGDENSPMYFGVGGAADNTLTTISKGYNWSVYAEFPIDGKEHTLTVVRDGLYIALYKDSEKLWEHTFNDNALNVDTHIYALEGNSGNGWGYAGYMKNVRFFNRPLTDEEIQILAQEA